MEQDGHPPSRGPHGAAPRLRKLRRARRPLLDLDGEAADTLAHPAARVPRRPVDAVEHDLHQLLQRDALDGRGHGGAAHGEEVPGGDPVRRLVRPV